MAVKPKPLAEQTNVITGATFGIELGGPRRHARIDTPFGEHALAPHRRARTELRLRAA